MSAVGKQPYEIQQASPARRWLVTPLLLAAFSLYYFIDVSLRTTQKYFWFDELVTVYVSRLNLHSLWPALAHGVDFNPLGFYLVTKASKAIFGETLIGMRMPEIIAFWVFCLCLFVFVNRRAGPIAGLIAMTLPTITGTFYYAYEARPTALVLGFCGLALICWQITLERPDKRRWLTGFGVCLFGACLMHCYAFLVAVPFAIVELLNSLRFRRVQWSAWIAIVAPVAIAGISYVPLLKAYRSITTGTQWVRSSLTNIGNIAKFYDFLLFPCIVFVVAALAVLAADRILPVRFPDKSRDRIIGSHNSEIILGISFLALPLLGYAISRTIIHGFFIDRYFASALIGFCILIGLAAGAPKALDWMAVALAILLAFPVTWNFAALVWHRYRDVPEKLIEPSSRFTMNDSLNGPLTNYDNFLPKDSSSLIGALRFNDFLYLLYYAPDLRQRLYYIKESDHDFFEAGFENFHPWTEHKFDHGLSVRDFVHLAPHVYVIGDTVLGDINSYSQLTKCVREGGAITKMIYDDDHFMAELKSATTSQGQ